MRLSSNESGERALTLKLAVFFYAAMALGAAGYLWLRGRPVLIIGPSAHGHLWDLSLGVAAGVAIVALTHLLMQRSRALRDSGQLLAHALGRVTLRRAFVLALLSGGGEELLFRGALQPDLGLLITSVLFGLVHVPPVKRLIPWTLFALAAGFVLGTLFAVTDNLVAPFACHFTVNLVNLRALSREFHER